MDNITESIEFRARGRKNEFNGFLQTPLFPSESTTFFPFLQPKRLGPSIHQLHRQLVLGHVPPIQRIPRRAPHFRRSTSLQSQVSKQRFERKRLQEN